MVRQVVPGEWWVVPGEAMGGSLGQLGGSPEVVQVDNVPGGSVKQTTLRSPNGRRPASNSHENVCAYRTWCVTTLAAPSLPALRTGTTSNLGGSRGGSPGGSWRLVGGSRGSDGWFAKMAGVVRLRWFSSVCCQKVALGPTSTHPCPPQGGVALSLSTRCTACAHGGTQRRADEPA